MGVHDVIDGHHLRDCRVVLRTNAIGRAFHGVALEPPASLHVAVVAPEDGDCSTDQGELPEVGPKARPKPVVGATFVHRPGMDLNPAPQVRDPAHVSAIHNCAGDTQ